MNTSLYGYWNAVAFGRGTPSDAASGRGLFAAIAETNGSPATKLVMTSSDGQTWTARDAAAPITWKSVGWGIPQEAGSTGRFVAVGGVAVGGGGLVDDGTLGRVQYSNDGITWTLTNATGPNWWNSVVWAHELGMYFG